VNLSITTTGLVPWTIGSVEQIVFSPFLGNLPWNLAGGSATLLVVDPNGVQSSYPMAVQANGYGASVAYTVVGPANVFTNGDPPLPPWRLAFLAVDASGRTQKSRAFAFNVLSSPV
jgi:hypothetical protein